MGTSGRDRDGHLVFIPGLKRWQKTNCSDTDSTYRILMMLSIRKACGTPGLLSRRAGRPSSQVLLRWCKLSVVSSLSKECSADDSVELARNYKFRHWPPINHVSRFFVCYIQPCTIQFFVWYLQLEAPCALMSTFFLCRCKCHVIQGNRMSWDLLCFMFGISFVHG